MKKRFPPLVALLISAFLLSCASLPYNDDTGFLVSAQANSPEFPIYLNGAACKDMDGNPGLCSKRIRSGDTLALRFDPQPYAYDLAVSCSRPMQVPGASIPKDQPFELRIEPAQMAGLLSFVCIGEIFPQDRDQQVSSKWEVRIVVTDKAYVSREAITPIEKDGKHYLVLGQYARSAWVFDGKRWKHHSKDTVVEVPDPSRAQAVSESLAMRYNYWNWRGPVATRPGE